MYSQRIVGYSEDIVGIQWGYGEVKPEFNRDTVRIVVEQ